MSTPTMNTATALAELGADELPDPDIREQLDTVGFAAIPGVLGSSRLEEIRARLAELSEREGARAGTEVHQEVGTDRLSDLVNKGDVFEVFYTHPAVLAAVAYVLDGDVKLSSLNSRAALPGQGHQGLHADWGSGVGPEATRCATPSGCSTTSPPRTVLPAWSRERIAAATSPRTR